MNDYMSEGPIKILTKETWTNIKDEINRYENQELEKQRRNEERAKYVENSKEFIRNWPNCMKNVQNIHESRKHLKEDENENLKRFIEEEKVKRAEQHQEIVKNAKLRKFYDTDQVKTFKMAMNQVDVYHQRQAQIEEKAKMLANMALDSGHETFFDNLYKKSEEKESNQKTVECKIHNFQMEQVNEGHMKQAKEDEMEQKQFQQMLSDEIDHKGLYDEDDACKKLWCRNLDEQISVNAKFKRLEMLKEELLEKKNDLYQRRKTAINAERKRIHQHEFNEKQKKLSEFGYEISQKLAQKLEREKSNIKEQVEEQEERERKEIAERAAKKEQLRQEFLTGTETRLRERELQRQADASIKLSEQQRIRQEVEKYEQDLIKKHHKEMDEKKKLLKYYLEEMENEKGRRDKAKLAEEAYMQEKLNEILEEENHFEVYAKEAIEKAEAQGKCTHLLKKLAEKSFEIQALVNFIKRKQEIKDKNTC